MDIKALLDRIEGGDRSAFAPIVEHFQRPLFGYLGRLGMHQGPAEEVAQDTFVRAWQRLGDYDPLRGEFSTWLFTIARNLAFRELARAAGRNEVASGGELPDVPCERAQPEEAMIDAERRQRVHAALRMLPLGDRSALALAYFHELNLAEIAGIEGCTTGAIKVRLHRARQRLRQLLEDPNG